MIPELLTHAKFPLRDDVLISVPPETYVVTETMGSLDYNSYAYFALSVIWRGSVAKWPSPYGDIYGKLRKHESLFRQYLYDWSNFPHRTFVSVLIDTNDNNIHGLVAPSFHSEIHEKHRLRVFSFRVPGVIFRVFTESKIPADKKAWLNIFPIPIGFIKTDFSKLKSYQGAVRQGVDHRPVGKKLLKEIKHKGE